MHPVEIHQDFRVSTLDVTDTVRSLSRLDVWRSSWAIAFDWLIIVAAILIAERLGTTWAYLAAILVIAGRQHGLLVLMHESTHYRLARSQRANDVVSNWLLTYPCFIQNEAYRQNHLRHHKHLNTDDDPDWVRKLGRDEWTFPKSNGGIARVFAKYLVGYGILETALLIRALGVFNRKYDVPTKIAYYGALAALLTVTGGWGLLFWYWIVPLFGVFPVFNRMRSVAEHFGLPRTHVLNESRNLLDVRWWERLGFAPHNVNYHLDHHVFPSVPFYNLPALHAALAEQEIYARLGHQNDGYVFSRHSLVRDLRSAPVAEADASALHVA